MWNTVVLFPQIYDLMKKVKKVKEDFGNPDKVYNKAAKQDQVKCSNTRLNLQS